MTEAMSVSVIAQISQIFGVTEPALKLFLGILSGYPLALIYRKNIYNKPEFIQNVFFILAGLFIGFWNYGVEMFHCIFSIFFTYCAITLLKASALSVGVVFIFNFTYLLTGYYYSSTDSYDITWTMPYCILVLRLIGVAFDVFDGTRPTTKLSSDALKTALKEPPTLLQMMGHSLFPSAFLVGPQFSMRRYMDFLSGKFCQKDSEGRVFPPDSMIPALKRFSLGVFYFSVYQILSLFISDDSILSDEFGQIAFVKRMIVLGIWGRYTLYKYISCWLLTEGACIMFGLSYNGEQNGETIWDGVENIKLSIFENASEFNDYILSFNVNTNQWVAQHIYKRLKFLGNKHYSQAGVLLFLAVWHGLHSGYYLTFLTEFIVIYVERDVKSLVKSNEALQVFFEQPTVKMVVAVLLRFYTFVFMGWCLLPFALLQWPKYWKAFSNFNYAGFLLFFLWPILYAPLLRLVFKKTRKEYENKD